MCSSTRPPKHVNTKQLQLIFDEEETCIDISNYDLKKINCQLFDNVVGKYCHNNEGLQSITFFDSEFRFQPYKQKPKIELLIYLYNDGWFTTNWSDDTFQSVRIEFMDLDVKFRNKFFFKNTLFVAPKNIDKRSLFKIVG